MFFGELIFIRNFLTSSATPQPPTPQPPNHSHPFYGNFRPFLMPPPPPPYAPLWITSIMNDWKHGFVEIRSRNVKVFYLLKQNLLLLETIIKVTTKKIWWEATLYPFSGYTGRLVINTTLPR